MTGNIAWSGSRVEINMVVDSLAEFNENMAVVNAVLPLLWPDPSPEAVAAPVKPSVEEWRGDAPAVRAWRQKHGLA